ncbi:hypothetical protein M752DRAFT_284537 [Aspergillus phoenicis ATCC 13157]|uniref:F-box domain-containing protein n=1 Tax=Aspergillus phoenicis ATCC 13157 TaxID=1353007 RepID=A0A370PFS5_ASPPH|nr:hypothetical protein M752DRAFT_284537 [Aspergillus phoenicis ATCC 13157]
MLSQLPLELVDAIADLLPQHSLRSLRSVSTTLYAALFPRLHCAITFRQSFLGDGPKCRARDILQHARQLTVKAPIHIARFHHCVYNSDFFPPARSPRGLTLGSPHEPTAHRGFLDSLSSQIHRAFALLEPGTLHSFQYILRLSLINDGTCPHAGQHLEGLSCLTALTELEWEGVQNPSEASALRGCLQQNSRHLKALSIGFLSAANLPARRDYADILDLSPSSFCDDCPRLDIHGYSLLTSLSLSRISFPSALLPGVQQSPFHALQALTLRDCPNELHYLQLLARSSRPVSLRHFEISSDYLRESGERLAFIAIVEFLLSFRGLQYLYLKVSNFPQLLPGLDDAIHHHRSTLRGLVFHERRLMAIDSERIFEELQDVTVTSPTIARILRKTYSPIALGLSAFAQLAQNLLDGQPIGSSIQILHLRFSGEERIYYGLRREIVSELQKDMDPWPWSRTGRLKKSNAAGINFWPRRKASEVQEFMRLVQWAFGPAGLPALQILAFGDFSHGDRYREQQVLLRRKKADGSSDVACHRGGCTANRTFCLADIDDNSLWDDLPLDGLRFLSASACPSTELMESPYDL